ncbi:hypothetical protein NUM3379_12950 [Kineococcus sp. NUM-3379]
MLLSPALAAPPSAGALTGAALALALGSLAGAASAPVAPRPAAQTTAQTTAQPPAPDVAAPDVAAPNVAVPDMPAPDMPAPDVAAPGAAPHVAVRAGLPAAVAGAGHRWPLAPAPRVLRGFDVLESPYAPGHRGADLGAAAGAPVLASAGGTVTFAGPVAGRGVVVVAHADGLHTTYEPLEPAVRAGAAVGPGQPLGALARDGRHCAPVSCLHWGARRGAGYVDPLSLLTAAAPPVLLPLGRPA